MTLATKPCECGREGCIVTAKPDRSPAEFRRQRFRCPGCASWWNACHNPRMREIQRLGGAAAAAKGMHDEPSAGALVTHSAWLYRPSGRIMALRQAHGIVVP